MKKLSFLFIVSFSLLFVGCGSPVSTTEIEVKNSDTLSEFQKEILVFQEKNGEIFEKGIDDMGSQEFLNFKRNFKFLLEIPDSIEFDIGFYSMISKGEVKYFPEEKFIPFRIGKDSLFHVLYTEEGIIVHWKDEFFIEGDIVSRENLITTF